MGSSAVGAPEVGAVLIRWSITAALGHVTVLGRMMVPGADLADDVLRPALRVDVASTFKYLRRDTQMRFWATARRR